MTIVQGFAKFNALICTIPWCTSLFAWLPQAEGADFDIEFAPDYDLTTYERSIKDSVTSSRAHLPVILRARSQD